MHRQVRERRVGPAVRSLIGTQELRPPLRRRTPRVADGLLSSTAIATRSPLPRRKVRTDKMRLGIILAYRADPCIELGAKRGLRRRDVIAERVVDLVAYDVVAAR